MPSSASPGEPRPADDGSDREGYGWATRIYAAAHDEHPRWVEQGDGGCQDVDSLLGDMLAEQVATLSEYLGLPPDEERSDADISDEIIRMRAELDRLREQRGALSVGLREMARRLTATRRKAIAGIDVSSRRWTAAYGRLADTHRAALAERDALRAQRDAALALLHPIESFCGWHDIAAVREALGETEDETAAAARREFGVSE